MEIGKNIPGILVSVLISIILMFFLSIPGGFIAGLISNFIITKISKEYLERFKEGYNLFALAAFISVVVLIVLETILQMPDFLSVYIIENRVGHAEIYEMLTLLVSILIGIINIPAYFLGAYLGFRLIK